jgi:hypothetical protein
VTQLFLLISLNERLCKKLEDSEKTDIGISYIKLEQAISRIRRILWDADKENSIIETIRNEEGARGYQFIAEVSSIDDHLPTTTKLVTFESWLRDYTAPIKWILVVCLTLTFIISLTFSSQPIENAQGFSTNDFNSPQALAAKLSAPEKGPISAYICNSDNQAKESVCGNKTINKTDAQIKNIFKDIFNRLLTDSSLYSKARFERVDLSEQSKQLLASF